MSDVLANILFRFSLLNMNLNISVNPFFFSWKYHKFLSIQRKWRWTHLCLSLLDVFVLMLLRIMSDSTVAYWWDGNRPRKRLGDVGGKVVKLLSPKWQSKDFSATRMTNLKRKIFFQIPESELNVSWLNFKHQTPWNGFNELVAHFAGVQIWQGPSWEWRKGQTCQMLWFGACQHVGYNNHSCNSIHLR